ncbi:MAG TPA: ABC transporter permease [Candidatus Limnocylindrales bacterium]|nr:ABC transporter permease [Candidatus Limnocylindrales bacterium]
MLKYLVRRLLAAIPVLLGLSVVLFAFVHLLPGDPVAALLGQHATPELTAQIREQLGLNKPLYEQYVIYLGQLLSGDLGKSVINNRSVVSELALRFPGTIELTGAALVFAIGLGIPLGRLAARHAQGWTDGVVTVISLLGISIPIFILGYTLQFFLSVQLKWLPTSGRLDPRTHLDAVTNFMLVDSLLAGRLDVFVDAVKHLILPAIALGSIPLAIITRITRAAVLDVANEDYVRTARAKGLSERRVDDRHVMRNAWLPVVTVIGLQVGGLLAGAVITETVFSWNGVGRYVVEAIQDHDYLVVQSTILVFALIFLAVNLLVDVGYAFLNPRIRFS